MAGLTVDDIQDVPENLRVELHNGNLVVRVPGTLWHEKIVEAIVLRFASKQRFAATNPGIKRTARDTRVPDVGVFFTEPTDWDTAYHEPSELEIVVEVWWKSSDEKDHHEMQWYADRGIPEYWLVTLSRARSETLSSPGSSWWSPTGRWLTGTKPRRRSRS